MSRLKSDKSSELRNKRQYNSIGRIHVKDKASVSEMQGKLMKQSILARAKELDMKSSSSIKRGKALL